MPAAPPGTVALSCTTGDGILTVTAHFDPDSGAFSADALTVAGAGTGQLKITLADGGSTITFVGPGAVVTADRLAAKGITSWTQVHGIALAADTP